MTTLLEAIELNTAPNPDATVIWMHGLGDTGHGWSEVVPALKMPPTMRVRFLFPHAPQIPVSINNGHVMPAWYDFRDADFSSRADLPGVRRSQGQIEALIDRERARGIDDARIVLAGFSQGGALALYAGLRHSQRLAGIVALSTYLIGADTLATEPSPANRDVPIFMAQGTHDPVVRLAWAEGSRKALVDAGWKVEWHTWPMEHSAVVEELAAAGVFLRHVLAG